MRKSVLPLVASILAMAPASGAAAAGTGAFGDDFESGGYAGNTGSFQFGSDWAEVGEQDGPETGDVSVSRSGSCSSGRCLTIDGAGQARGASRGADLVGTTRAILRFALTQTGKPGDGRLVVRVSNDGGGTWVTVASYDRHQHTVRGAIDITRHATAQTIISFRTTPGSVHSAYVDDVELAVSYEDPPQDPIDEPPDKGGPPDHADPQGKPHTTTTTTTTAAPPTGIDPDPTPHDPAHQGRDVVIGIAPQDGFSPPAWTASEQAALRARLAATDLSESVPGVRTLRGDREPLTDVSGAFTRPSRSVRSSFVPTTIFAALLAWATITGFERRRRDPTPTER